MPEVISLKFNHVYFRLLSLHKREKKTTLKCLPEPTALLTDRQAFRQLQIEIEIDVKNLKYSR